LSPQASDASTVRSEAERRLDVGLALALDALQQDGLGARVPAAAQQARRLQAFGLVGAAQQRGRAHQAQLDLEDSLVSAA
jgi:hypothetical protein